MQKIRLAITISEFQIKTGGFKNVIAGTVYFDYDASAKQLFESMIEEFQHDIKNKFFIMDVEGTSEDEYSHNFYTIRTNKECKVEDIQIISPNTVNKDLLIDAILGCKVTDHFAISCNDAVIKKCFSMVNGGFEWKSDAHKRLQKVNSLRLKEIYKRLKS